MTCELPIPVGQISSKFELLTRSLNKYLEAKRQFFSRLYFLSNEQLIELVTLVDDVLALPLKMTQMFEGISEFRTIYKGDAKQRVVECVSVIKAKQRSVLAQNIGETAISSQAKSRWAERAGAKTSKADGTYPEIYAVVNQSGEEVYFNETVTITNNIEQWMKRLESTLYETLQEAIRNCLLNLQNEQHKNGRRYLISWMSRWPT
jgi:hypothetical protein